MRGTTKYEEQAEALMKNEEDEVKQSQAYQSAVVQA